MAQPILLATGAQVRSLSLRSRLWEFSELDGAAYLAGHWRSSPQPVAQIAALGILGTRWRSLSCWPLALKSAACRSDRGSGNSRNSMAQPILLATGAQVRSLSLRSRLWEFSELDGAAYLAGHWRSSPQPVPQIAPLGILGTRWRSLSC